MLLHCSSWVPLLHERRWMVKGLFGFKKSRSRNGILQVIIVKSVDKESEFEIDREKARDSLRKLDEQLQSLSTKQVTPSKIRAQDINPASVSREEGENYSLWFSGSFLSFTASFLLIFTIFYNIIFLTVIKPSIDGEEPEPEPETFQYADILQETQKEQLATTTEFSAGP